MRGRPDAIVYRRSNGTPVIIDFTNKDCLVHISGCSTAFGLSPEMCRRNHIVVRAGHYEFDYFATGIRQLGRRYRVKEWRQRWYVPIDAIERVTISKDAA